MWYNVLMIVALCGITYILKKIFSREPNNVKFYFNFFIFYFLSSLVATLLIPYLLISPKNVRNPRVGARILKHVTKLYDLKWQLRNGEILAAERAAIIISNHQSTLDILGMFNIWEVVNKMTVIAKKEVFYVWPFGIAAYLAGIVFIDRKNAKGAYMQLKDTSDVMIKNKAKIWLFPEGTRNKDFTKLLPFKRGAFTIAVNAQVPIIPVVFSPYYFINARKYIFNKGHVIIKCLEPVPTEGLTMDDVPSLIDRIHDMMQQEYKELSKEVLEALPSDYPHSNKAGCTRVE